MDDNFLLGVKKRSKLFCNFIRLDKDVEKVLKLEKQKLNTNAC